MTRSRCGDPIARRSLAVAVALSSFAAPAARADDASGLVLVPVAPCVLARTAFSALGRMHAGDVRTLLARGTVDLSAQGGSAAGCAIPAEARALAVTLRVSNPDGAGQLKLWAEGQPEPRNALVDYAPGVAPLTLPATAFLCMDGCGERLRDQDADAGGAVRIDVLGYFIPEGDGPRGAGGPRDRRA